MRNADLFDVQKETNLFINKFISEKREEANVKEVKILPNSNIKVFYKSGNTSECSPFQIWRGNKKFYIYVSMTNSRVLKAVMTYKENEKYYFSCATPKLELKGIGDYSDYFELRKYSLKEEYTKFLYENLQEITIKQYNKLNSGLGC